MPAFIQRRSSVLQAFACSVMLLFGAAQAQTGPNEYQVKAVFLFNFSQFVSWPPQAFPATQTPLVIGVLGEDPFGTDLDEVVRGETANGRPLSVQRYRSAQDIGECHILFVSRSEHKQLGEVLAALKSRNILTVSDDDDFTRRGGMVRFVNDRNRIRLHINLGAAEAAGLTISSKLLRPAQIVRTGER